MPEYAMTLRTPSKTITFNRPFCLKGVDRWLPPGNYRVMTDEEVPTTRITLLTGS